MLLFAHQPEGLIATAIVAVIAGLLLPVFQKVGFGSISSLAYSIACGIAAILVLTLCINIPNLLAGVKQRHRRSRSGVVDNPRRDDSNE